MRQPEHLIAVGDCRKLLPLIPSGSVHCVVTSPPYWGLRDYGTGRWEGGSAECDHVKSANPQSRLALSEASTRGGAKKVAENPPMLYKDECAKCGAVRVDDQIGLEPTPEAYVETMVAVFREVRRILRDDGVCWLNLGDCYNGSRSGPQGQEGQRADRSFTSEMPMKRIVGLKPKDLCMIPERVSLALQADGWWIRAKPPWLKPNPMPESVNDRPTTAHESIYMLTKSARYFYDADAVRAPHTMRPQRRPAGRPVDETPRGSDQPRQGWSTAAREEVAADGHPLGRNRRTADWFFESLEEAVDWHEIQEAKHKALAGHYRNVRERGGTAFADDGTPLAFKIATTPFNGWTKTSRLVHVTTGVLSDDTIRKASSDCPVHGNPDRRCDERAGSASDHTSRTGDDPDPERSPSPTTNSTSSESSTPDRSSGSPGQPHSTVATGRSIETSRTALVPETTSPCKPSGQTTSDTGDTPRSPASFGQHLGTSESRTSSADSGDSASPETTPCTADSESRQVGASVESLKEKGCTCTFYKVVTDNISHFAVMPGRLVEPMIRLGTSEAGCCPKCGAPWERQVEEVGREVSGNPRGERAAHCEGRAVNGAALYRKVRVEAGWAPGCRCSDPPFAPVPCTVMDPFGGAGTTGSVADGLGRRFVGIELNPGYADMAAKRIARPHAPVERPPAPTRGQQTFFD